MRVAWQSEIDPYACKVLAKHWPEVLNHGNIKEIDWRRVEPVDVICGGYPCQPFSTAGKRRGEKDPRHLWPWVREAISQLRPRYAILENVRGHLSLGGTTVLGEIAALGYDAEWRVVSAASVGANHRRDRVIIVAYPNSQNEPDGAKHKVGMVAYADLRQIGRWNGRDATSRSAVFGGEHQRRGTQGYEGWKWWEVEPDVGRVADGIPHRVDRLRGLGNAVVPQVAEVIGRLVVAHAEQN
jgi:DNA (cytosine-5)-methyltransferase 1